LLLLSTFSVLIGEPLLIPAVGASAYLVFGDPQAEASAPRNVLVGHALGAAIGWLMLELFHLRDAPGGLSIAVTWPRAGAVASSLATTIGILRSVRCTHPPAGATTMIVAVGILPRAHSILDFLLAGAAVVVYASIVCRAAGHAYPIWNARTVRET
jgi:CBS-domain-containing membrane protein